MRTLSITTIMLAIVLACRKPAPKVDEPVLVISLVLEGARAEVMERAVVGLVENAARRISGVRSVESRIEEGRATITLAVAKAEVDRVGHEMQHAFGPQLPEELAMPMITRRRKDAVLWLAVRGSLPVGLLSEHTRHVIRPRLQKVAGVSVVELHGIAREITVVTPDLARLDAHGVTVADVVAALEGGGAVRGNVKLEDVAIVGQSIERDATIEPAIAVYVQPVAKSPAVTDALREEIAGIRAELPPGIEIVDVPSPARPPAPLVVTVSGPELDGLDALAGAIVARFAEKGITDVVRDPPPGEPDIAIEVDRARVAELGIAPEDVRLTLRALRGLPVAKHDRRDVVIRLADDKLEAAISAVKVRGGDGALVPLANVVKITYGKRHTILRRDGERVITLAVYAPKAKLGIAREIASEHKLRPGYRAILTP